MVLEKLPSLNPKQLTAPVGAVPYRIPIPHRTWSIASERHSEHPSEHSSERHRAAVVLKLPLPGAREQRCGYLGLFFGACLSACLSAYFAAGASPLPDAREHICPIKRWMLRYFKKLSVGPEHSCPMLE